MGIFDDLCVLRVRNALFHNSRDAKQRVRHIYVP